MRCQTSFLRNRQRGVSTLVVAIILLIAATFLTFFAAKVGMQEQRMSGNDYRQKKTFALAEAGLDRAKAWLAGNRQDFATWGWATCSASQTTPPCGNGSANQYGTNWSWISVYRQSAGSALAGLTWPQSTQDGPFILTETTPAAITANTSFQPVVLVSQARSDDQTGRAVVRQSMSRFLVAQPGPMPPLMAPSVGLGGNFTVVGNPDPQLNVFDPTSGISLSNCDFENHDSSGKQQLLSIWSANPVSLTGSQQTCFPGSYRDGSSGISNRCIGQTIADPVTGQTPTWNQCNCQVDPAYPSPYSSASAGTNDDVKQNDSTFPGDIFLYIFGRTRTAVKALAQSEGRVLPDCTTLNASSTGLYWITGACSISSNAVIGSRSAPVILVYETSFDSQGGADIWGLVMGVDMKRTLTASPPSGPAPYYYNSDFTPGTPPSTSLHGGFTVHGGLISEGSVTAAAGTYNILYDPCVLAAMGPGSANDQYGPIQGSWTDGL